MTQILSDNYHRYDELNLLKGRLERLEVGRPMIKDNGKQQKTNVNRPETNQEQSDTKLFLVGMQVPFD